MPVNLYDGRRRSIKSDTPRPIGFAEARIDHPVAIQLMANMIAKTAEAPIAEPIAFTTSDVSDAFGVTPEIVGAIIASLVRHSFLVEKADGQFGFKAGYVLGPAART